MKHESNDNVNTVHIDITKLFQCKKCKKYLHYVYQFILFAMTVMCLFLFIINEQMLKLFKGLFTINIYTSLIKGDIYFAAVCLFDSCVEAKESDVNGLNDNKWRLSYRENELIEHYTTLSLTINDFVDKNQIKEIYEILAEENEYVLMLKKYNINYITSSLFVLTECMIETIE